MAQIRIKAGTRAQLDAAALANGLIAREPYFITDEARFAVGTATNAYQAMAKQGEGGGGGGGISDAPSDGTIYGRKNGGWVAAGGGSTAGRMMIPIMAGSMQPSASGGSGVLSNIATSANQPDVQTLNFHQSTQQHCQFAIPFPKRWNRGTITARFRWSHASTTTNFGCVWGIQAVAVSDNEAINQAYGTAVEVTDTGGTTNRLYVSPETSAMTVAGTPADGDTVFFRVYRKAADAADTLAIVSRLHGVDLFITTNAENDA